MQTTSINQDLFDHNDWANQKILGLCCDLVDDQLDQPREMGFGSLRNTLFHVLEAEKIWLERWLGQAWRPLQTNAGQLSVAEIADQSQKIAKQRNELIARESESGFSRTVEFQDSEQATWRFSIGDLLNHVSNHGIHHRAQALSFLRSFDLTVAGGLDYLFWKMARPSCTLPDECLEPLRAYGLEAATAKGSAPNFDRQRIVDYFAYNDWAMRQVTDAVNALDPAQLDHEFKMGMGTLRKNLQHIIDAERWWLANWESDNAPFPRGEEPRSLEAMNELFEAGSNQRNSFISALDSESADRIVHVTAGGPVTCFRVTESLLQLCGHGTHHRAQCLNMLRQLSTQPPGIDLVEWLRIRTRPSSDATY